LAGNEKGPWSVRLVGKNGQPILAMNFPEGQTETALSIGQQLQLFAHPQQPVNFSNKRWVVGFATAFKDLPMGLVITENYDYVYADVIHLRDRIILTAIIFTLFIGLSASIIARRVILPLQTLTRGVLRVAQGDLDVCLDIIREDELGIVTGMFNEMVQQLKKNKEELEQLAVTDPLTKLANRKRIMTSLDVQIENFRRYGNLFSLLMVDIDNFKVVNDTHGHLVGDAVLVQMALIFTSMLRTMDIAGRYGGEEFLVILGQTESRQAMSTAERIRQAVEEYPFVYEDVEVHVTISVGVAGIANVEDTDNSLISRADAALYDSKAAGRNQVIFGREKGGSEKLPSSTG
jgi:diguanylate cyclase (GGDEF)-like protein